MNLHPIHGWYPQFSLGDLARISPADYLHQLYRLPKLVITSKGPAEEEPASKVTDKHKTLSLLFKGRTFSFQGVEEEEEKRRWIRNFDFFNAEPAAKLKRVDLLTACFSFVTKNPEQRMGETFLLRKPIDRDLQRSENLLQSRMTDLARSNHLPLTGSCSPTGTSRSVRGRSPGYTLPGGRATLPPPLRMPKLHFPGPMIHPYGIV
ncbi:MAG: hypothetical protein ACYTG7_17620 [Planctomycetota bacterium]